ncbi:hypothetical protein [Streptosporangium sp. NPDC020145]|uniref:hypothetical protein n=1 Tax=Streptosporangium sp. NPDC020145 TaxID=3154694 RepID=UPI00342CE95A
MAFTAFAGQRLSPLTGLPLLLFARLVFTFGALVLFAFMALMFSPFLLLTDRPRPMVPPPFQLRGVFTHPAFAALVNTPPLGFGAPFTPDPIGRLGVGLAVGETGPSGHDQQQPGGRVNSDPGRLLLASPRSRRGSAPS